MSPILGYRVGVLDGALNRLVMYLYSVMQSGGNSFFGDVVLGSFNMASRDENNIIYQMYESKDVRIFIMTILILYNFIPKCTLA